MCSAAFVGKSSGKGLEKRSKTHQKHKIQTCQVSSQHCPSSSAGSATSGTMMLGWKVRDRSNLSFYHGLRLMTVPIWCFLTFDNIWRHVIWYSKNKALCWFWFLLGVAMTVFGAFYECFCFKPVYKSVQAGQINWCKEWLVALISIVSSPVTCLVDLVLRKHLCMLDYGRCASFQAREWTAEEDGSGPTAAPTPYIMIQWEVSEMARVSVNFAKCSKGSKLSRMRCTGASWGLATSLSQSSSYLHCRHVCIKIWSCKHLHYLSTCLGKSWNKRWTGNKHH